MNRGRLFVLLFLVLVIFPALFRVGVADFVDEDRKNPVPAFSKLKRGMTPEQVRQLVPAPKHVARQILYHRYREQWVYDAPNALRLTFDCPRGQKPQLVSAP
jgi:hypothetical protein